MIPVLCTAEVSPEHISTFLTRTYAGYPEAAQTLVLITTTDWSHYSTNLSPKHLTHGGGPTLIPSRPPWTHNFTSPFLSYTPEEVSSALQSAHSLPGEISRDYCIILDSQTIKDERTVLCVKTKKTEGEKLPPGYEGDGIVMVRETFEEANGLMQSASVGVSSLVGTLWNQVARERQEL